VEDLRSRIKTAFHLPQKAAEKAREKQGKNYLKVWEAALQEVDRVLVKVVTFDGKHKVADRWEEDPYQIMHQPNPDVPVFVVMMIQAEHESTSAHRLHRPRNATDTLENNSQAQTEDTTRGEETSHR
jgi:hypothetical protein